MAPKVSATPRHFADPQRPDVSDELLAEPALAGYLLPGPVMAAVRQRIETLAQQETLEALDAEMRRLYADRFPERCQTS